MSVERPAGARPFRHLNQPLLHFLVLGGLLFLLDRRLQRPPRRIDVTKETLDGLARDHQRRTGAPPSAAQAQALLAQYLDDEILYREALALGLDRGDIIIRRRLLQKMEFLAEAEAPEPDDAALQALLARHPERYALPARTSLRHVFVSRERHGAAAPAVAAALRARLSSPTIPADAWRDLGDPFLRGAELREHSDAALAAVFGDDFTAALRDVPVAPAWSAPLPSRYGLHLVRVTDRQPPRPARLAEVRDPLRRDLREETRQAARSAAAARLRGRYEIHLPRSQP